MCYVDKRIVFNKRSPNDLSKMHITLKKEAGKAKMIILIAIFIALIYKKRYVLQYHDYSKETTISKQLKRSIKSSNILSASPAAILRFQLIY